MNNTDIWSDSDIKKDQRHEELFIKKKRAALLKAEDRRRRNELKEISKLNRPVSENKQKRTTTKVLMYFILDANEMLTILSSHLFNSSSFLLSGLRLGATVVWHIGTEKIFFIRVIIWIKICLFKLSLG